MNASLQPSSNRRTALILTGLTLLTALGGQLAARQGGVVAPESGPLNPYRAVSYGCLILRGLLWLALLRRLRLALAYPLMSLTYILVPAAAHIHFGESVGPAKLAGALLIIGGVILIGRGEVLLEA